MKKFLISTTLFISITFALGTAFDYSTSRFLVSGEGPMWGVWKDILEGRINSDVIVMGTSRASVQFAPLIFDSILGCNTYNLGIDGSCANRQIHRYNIYRKKNVKPKLIIQNIDAWLTLGYTVGFRYQQFFPFIYNPEMQEIIQDEPFYWYDKIPSMRYRGYSKIFNLWKRDLMGLPVEEPTQKGYHGNELTWDGAMLKAIDTLSFQPDKRTLKMFLDYVEQAKQEGIEMVFVYAPFYYEGLNKFTNLDECYALFDSIATAYDVPILDYSFCNLSYDTAYFYNASHLNKMGAEIFSTRLAHDLDSLNIYP